MLKPGLEKLFREYSEAHQHPMNRLTHKIAIPLIVFHILAMLDWVELFPIPGTTLQLSLAHLFFASAIAWYLSQDVKLGVIMAVAFAPCIPIGWYMPWTTVVAIAVVGWLIQLAGHVVWEKRSPSFLTNLLQALVGPVYFVALLTGDWPPAQEQLPSSSRAA